MRNDLRDTLVDLLIVAGGVVLGIVICVAGHQ